MAVLLEDNEVLAKQVVDREESFLKYLILVKDFTGMKGVATCQVLHNLFTSLKWYDHNTSMEGASDAGLLPTLVAAMDQTEEQSGTRIRNGDSTHSSPDQIIQLALEVTAAIATSLEEALEHASRPRNIQMEEEFTGFDDTEVPNGDAEPEDAEGDEMDVEESENDNGEMDEHEIAADMEMVTGDGSDVDDAAGETATLDRLVKRAAPQIINLALQNNDNRSQALSALNNIAWAVSVIDFSDERLMKNGYLKRIYELWGSVAQRIWEEIVSPVLASNTADIELASITTSIAWAVARCVKGGIKIQPGEQLKFMALYQASRNMIGEGENGVANAVDGGEDPFQSLGVKSLGALGSLAQHPAPIDLNREIGAFLLTVLSALPETPPADAVEALNQIFDIYADKEYGFDEPVFWGNNFCQRLEAIQPKLKSMAKTIDKRLFPELRERVDEALLNLHRFLSFKRKEKKQNN